MPDPMLIGKIRDNWRRVKAEVAEAAELAGRPQDAVRIIGVTKYVDTDTTRVVIESGCQDVGENRPQALWEKAESLQSFGSVRWHMIGHLQRNKVRRVLRHNVTIHSIDSGRLIDTVAEEAQKTEKDCFSVVGS